MTMKKPSLFAPPPVVKVETSDNVAVPAGDKVKSARPPSREGKRVLEPPLDLRLSS